MILKRYILIFTLALISCAGTNYIHTIVSPGEAGIQESYESISDELDSSISIAEPLERSISKDRMI